MNRAAHRANAKSGLRADTVSVYRTHGFLSWMTSRRASGARYYAVEARRAASSAERKYRTLESRHRRLRSRVATMRETAVALEEATSVALQAEGAALVAHEAWTVVHRAHVGAERGLPVGLPFSEQYVIASRALEEAKHWAEVVEMARMRIASLTLLLALL
jgi:hypothetical protein